MVEVAGLEPTASASRTQRSTKLSHTSFLSLHFFAATFVIIAGNSRDVNKKISIFLNYLKKFEISVWVVQTNYIKGDRIGKDWREHGEGLGNGHH